MYCFPPWLMLHAVCIDHALFGIASCIQPVSAQHWLAAPPAKRNRNFNEAHPSFDDYHIHEMHNDEMELTSIFGHASYQCGIPFKLQLP